MISKKIAKFNRQGLFFYSFIAFTWSILGIAFIRMLADLVPERKGGGNYFGEGDQTYFESEIPVVKGKLGYLKRILGMGRISSIGGSLLFLFGSAVASLINIIIYPQPKRIPIMFYVLP